MCVAVVAVNFYVESDFCSEQYWSIMSLWYFPFALACDCWPMGYYKNKDNVFHCFQVMKERKKERKQFDERFITQGKVGLAG